MTGALFGVVLLVATAAEAAIAGVVFGLWRRQRQQSGLDNTQSGSSPQQANEEFPGYGVGGFGGGDGGGGGG